MFWNLSLTCEIFVQSLGRNLETFSVMHKCKSTVVQNSYDLQGGWGLAALALASYIGPFDIRCGGGGGSWQKYQLGSKRHTILGASVRGKWRDCRFLKSVHIFVCTASFASARILLQMDDHLVDLCGWLSWKLGSVVLFCVCTGHFTSNNSQSLDICSGSCWLRAAKKQVSNATTRRI